MFEYLQIETTTFCNATCWFCPNHLVPKEHMELDLIYKIIDDTRDMGVTYRPFGLGEPLVDTRLPDIARYIKEDPTAKVELNSNGQPMTLKTERKIAPFVDIMRFSVDGFTKKYSVKNLVYYECFEDMANAIFREKRLKTWQRQWKVDLISSSNPKWLDLYDDIST